MKLDDIVVNGVFSVLAKSSPKVRGYQCPPKDSNLQPAD
jgi:hypothetical protein